MRKNKDQQSKYAKSIETESTIDSPQTHLNNSMDSRIEIKNITNLMQGRKSQLVLFSFTTLIFNICLTLIIPFYPSLANDQAGLNFGMIGFVISCTPLGSIFGGLILGPRLNQIGRRQVLIASYIVQFLSLTIFGLLGSISNQPALFIALSITSRFLQGIARSVSGTIIFSYIPLLWPRSFEYKVGILESQIILGIMIGPAIGAGLNICLGYGIPFYLLALYFLLSIIPTVMLIPEDSRLIENKRKQALSLCTSFRSIQFISTCFIIMICVGTLTYMSPIFVHHLRSFRINQDLAAFIYSFPAISYIACIFLVPKLMKRWAKTNIITLGVFLSLLSFLIIAPFWNDNPMNANEILVALLLQGIAQAFVVIPSIPKLMELTRPLYPEGAPVANLAAGMFLTSISIGNFFCPNIGGKVYDDFGGNTIWIQWEKKAFQQCLLVLAIIMFFCLLQFLIFGGGFFKLLVGKKHKKENVRSDTDNTDCKEQQLKEYNQQLLQ